MLFQIYSGPSLNIFRAVPMCLSVCLYVCFSVFLSFYQSSICVSLFLYVCESIFFSVSVCVEGNYNLFSIISSHFRLVVVILRALKRFKLIQGYFPAG